MKNCPQILEVIYNRSLQKLESSLSCVAFRVINRGRYDIKIFPTFLQMHGKTFDYKISNQQILRLFALPHYDRRQMFFIVRASSGNPTTDSSVNLFFFIFVNSD